MSDSALADFPLVRRPAVGAKAIECFGPLTLESVPGATILHVLGKPGDAQPKTPDGPDLRSAGPGQWFAIGPSGESDTGVSGFSTSVFLVDQSHGRVLIRISGEPVRKMLAKGTAVDLHPDQFAIGMATTTLIGHISVNLCRTGEDVFELLVLRGFAESLWQELIAMSAEFA